MHKEQSGVASLTGHVTLRNDAFTAFGAVLPVCGGQGTTGGPVEFLRLDI